MIPQSVFYGGCTARTSMAADIALAPASDRIQRLVPQFDGLAVRLPDATWLTVGGPHFYLLNEGAYSVTVKDHGGSTVGTLAAGKAFVVLLLDESTAAGDWFCQEMTC